MTTPTPKSDVTKLAMSRRKFLLRAMAFTGCAAVGVLLESVGLPVSAQGAPPGGGPGNQTDVLDTFLGVTTDGTVIPDLYSITSTGVTTEPVRVAAEAFLAALTDDQRAAVQFTIDDDEWRKWSNVDGYQRQGVDLEAMTDDQRTAAYNLLGAALSAKGLQLSRDIMRLNTTEGEIMNNLTRFNEYLYYFTIMGTPSDTEPWGFQLDGHHLVINYFILGDQVVMTPVFMGAEPPIATSGEYDGLSVLQTEQDKGLAMINALTGEQQAVAIIQVSKTGDNNLAEAFKDNVVIDYAGILASEFTDDQKTQFIDLIAEWVGNMDDGHAAIKMAEVESHLDETYFAWVGDTGADAVFYYRIQSPVILIEFDHESPGPEGQYLNLAQVPSRNHIHTVVRTPNGNDYGKDLLRQHYLTDHLATETPEATASAAVLPLLAFAGKQISSAPMSSAPMKYDAEGAVAWDKMWTDFCDLALAGGPPHRGTLLEPAPPEAVRANPEAYAGVVVEIARGLRMVTGLPVVTDAALGWVGLVCINEAMAAWLQQAIIVENVSVWREGQVLYLPAGPAYRLEGEIKNVITVAAKTLHYWRAHRVA